MSEHLLNQLAENGDARVVSPSFQMIATA